MEKLIGIKDCNYNCVYPEGHQFNGGYLHTCAFCREVYLAKKDVYFCYQFYQRRREK
jgi:hypothetical protein